MEGVTTAIVGFIFVCMALPRLVKNRPQFYAAFAAVVLIVLFDTLAHLFSTTPPPDVAATTLFLCSPAARNISGQAISVHANTEYL